MLIVDQDDGMRCFLPYSNQSFVNFLFIVVSISLSKDKQRHLYYREICTVPTPPLIASTTPRQWAAARR